MLPGLPWAAEAQQQQPIMVEADRLEMDNASGVSHYQGNVVMNQGNLQLRANSVTLHSRGSELTRAVANGTPVHLEKTDPKTGEQIKANATNMEYKLTEGLLEMNGKAHLWRDKDEFTGEHIVYDLNKRVVRATGQKTGEEGSRVKVILQPQKKEKDKEQQP